MPRLQSGSTCPPRVKALLEQMQAAVEEFIKRATKLLDVSRSNRATFGWNHLKLTFQP